MLFLNRKLMVAFRQLLDHLLEKPAYAVLAPWDDAARAEITLFWHKLDGSFVQCVKVGMKLIECWQDGRTRRKGSKRSIIFLETVSWSERSATAVQGFSSTWFVLSTLSNMSVSESSQSRHANLNFDVIFSGDLLKSYKPNPAMYLGACTLLDLKPEEVAMVAAHIYDLRAAASFGVRRFSLAVLPCDARADFALAPHDLRSEDDRGPGN